MKKALLMESDLGHLMENDSVKLTVILMEMSLVQMLVAQTAMQRDLLMERSSE